MRLYAILMGIASSILLARYLGPQDFGKYAFIISVVSILSSPVGSGLSQLVTRETAAFSYTGHWAWFRGLLRTAYFWVLAFSFFVLMTFIILKFLKIGFVGGGISHYLFEIYAMISFAGVAAVSAGALKGLGLPARAEMPGQLAGPTLKLLTFGLMVWLLGTISLSEAVVIQMVTTFCVTILIVHAYRRAGPKVGSDARYKITEWGKALLPFTLVAMINIMNTQLSIIALGIFSSAEQVAGLRIAERVGQFVVLPMTLINMIIAPYLVRAYKANDYLKMQRITSQSTGWALMVSIPIGVILFCFGGFLIGRLFGTEYLGLAYEPMMVIILAQLVNVFFGPVGYLLLLTGNEVLVLKTQVMAVALSIVMLALLIPTYGAFGAACAIAGSVISWNLAMGFSVFKILKIKPLLFLPNEH